MSPKTYGYLLAVGASGVWLLANELYALEASFREFGWTVFILALATFLAEIFELEIVPRWSITTGIAIIISAIYIGGAPLAIMVLLLASLPAEIILRWDRIKDFGPVNFLLYVGFNVGQLAISIVVASHVFQLVADALIDIPAHNLPHINSIEVFAVLVATFLAYEVVNAVLVSIGITLTTPRRLSYSLKYSLKYLHIHFLTLGMIAILVSKIYFWEPDQPVNLLFVFIPLGLAHFSMRNYLRLREDSHSALMLISALLERRDEYTGEHSKDVTLLSVQLARALNLSDELIENIERGAEIHDIGKIGVPDAILLKLGPLTESEWEIMKEHPVIGAEILGKLEIYKDVVPIVLHEHEHWDGGGYPNGLKGETIPLGARVVAVADVYSALTTPRPYRLSQGRPLIYEHKEACEILREMAGKQLDPALVEVFVDDVDLGERLDKYLKESEAQDVNEQNQEEQA